MELDLDEDFSMLNMEIEEPHEAFQSNLNIILSAGAQPSHTAPRPISQATSSQDQSSLNLIFQGTVSENQEVPDHSEHPADFEGDKKEDENLLDLSMGPDVSSQPQDCEISLQHDDENNRDDTDDDEGDDEIVPEGKNDTDEDHTSDYDASPPAVTTTREGGVILTFARHSPVAKEDITSPSAEEERDEPAARGSVKDLIHAFEASKKDAQTGTTRPQPAVLPKPSKRKSLNNDQAAQEDGKGRDTSVKPPQHTPDSAASMASSNLQIGQESPQPVGHGDSGVASDAVLTPEEEVVITPEDSGFKSPEDEDEEKEEKDGEEDKEKLTNDDHQNDNIEAETLLSVTQDDVEKERVGSAQRGYFTPDTSSPVSREGCVSEENGEEEEADDDFVMAPEHRDELHYHNTPTPVTPTSMLPESLSASVSGPASKELPIGSSLEAGPETDTPQMVQTNSRAAQRQHTPTQQATSPTKHTHSPTFNRQKIDTPTQGHKSEDLSLHLREASHSPRGVSPKPMYDPRQSPGVQEHLSLGDGAFRPVPQRPQQMWGSHHESFAQAPGYYGPAWQHQQQHPRQPFPGSPHWPSGFNPNAGPPQHPPPAYRAPSPGHPYTPRNQRPQYQPHQIPQQQQVPHQAPHQQHVHYETPDYPQQGPYTPPPYSQQQASHQPPHHPHQMPHQGMSQPARHSSPAVTPTGPWGGRKQGHGGGMQQGVTEKGDGHFPDTPETSASPGPDTSCPQKLSTVQVSGVDTSVGLELLQLYFESPRKSQGGAITNVSDHRQQGYVLITFEDPSVVDHVLGRPHKIGRQPLSVTRPLHQASPLSDQHASVESADLSRKIEVRGGMAVLNQEMMELYFESSKAGGGPIENVEVNEEAEMAVITFVDAKTATDVLKRSHKVGSTILTVTPYQPPSPSATIKVSGLKHNASADLLQLYFESERGGGADVKDVKLDAERGEALVTFVDPAVVPDILQRNHTISKSKVTVSLSTATPSGSTLPSHDSAATPPPDPCTVEVRGLSAKTTQETLQFFFENKRRSGGGPTKDIQLDPVSGVAVITFEDADAAKRVVEKQHFKLDEQDITVTVPTPSTPTPARAASPGSESSSGLNTVIVRGLTQEVSEDTLLNYFENKRRSGGGPVTNVRTDFKKGVVFITFENPDDAAKVASRKQTLEGQTLTVQLHKPPKMMGDHILITGLPEINSSDQLRNFVEAKTGEDVKRILFGEEEGTAVVILGLQDINFEQVQKAVTKKPFMGQTLNIHQVPVTTTVLVRGFSQDSPVSEDTLQMYFENERRCGGGETSDVEIAGDGSYATVTFLEADVAARVASRGHTINGRHVDVSLYMECLGPSGGSDEPTLPIPGPLTIPDADQMKILLLQEIPGCANALQDSLKECHAVLEFETPDKARLCCSISPEESVGRQMIRAWSEDAMKKLQNFMQCICVEEVQATEEEFTAAEGRLREMAHNNGIGLRYDKQKGILYIIFDENEKALAESMQQTMKDVQRSWNRKMMEKKEVVPVGKGKLSMINGHNIWQVIREQFPEITTNINVDEGVVELSGIDDEIRVAKLMLLEVLSSVISTSQTWDMDLVCQLLEHHSAQSIIFATCLEKDPEGRLEFSYGGVEIMSYDGRRAEAMQVAARNAVQKRVITFTNENVEARTLPSWEELKASLLQRNHGMMLLHEDEHCLTMVSVSTTVKEDHQQLKDFLNENSIQQCAFDLEKPFHGLLKLYLRERQLGLTVTIDDVIFDEDMAQIKVKGNKACVDAAERMYNMFSRSIIHVSKTYTQPSMATFLQSSSWMATCTDIEHRLQCKILEPTPELENFLGNGNNDAYEEADVFGGRSSPDNAAFFLSSSSATFPSNTLSTGLGQQQKTRGSTRARRTANAGDVPIAPKTGPKPDIPSKPRIYLSPMSDITKEEHDILVNSTNPNLHLVNGLVSKALLGVGGPTLQQECSTKYPQGIQMGEIAVTGPGQQDGAQKLMCKRIFHCTLPETSDADTIKAVVRDSVTKCLTMADTLRESEKVPLGSIGLPVLGTGTLKYPPQLVAQTMFEAVLDYGKQHRATHISDVFFIVYKKDETNMQVFQDEHNKYKELLKQSISQTPDEEPEEVILPAQAGVKQYLYFEETRGRVSLVFLALDERRVQKAEAELMECYKKRVMKVQHDVTLLEQWDDLNVSTLVNVCRAALVDVTFNFTFCRIELRGFQENVDKIAIHHILKEAEAAIRLKQNARVIAQQIEWSAILVDNYMERPAPYDAINNYNIEMAYRNNEPQVVILDSDNVAFIIDFTAMEERSEVPPKDEDEEELAPMRVMRRDKIKESAMDAPLPDNWTDMKGQDIDCVPLNTADREYIQVATAFHSSVNNPTVQIQKIERVQNPTLYKQYMAMKQMMKASFPSDRMFEKDRLWHGTKGDIKDGIIRYGFNRSYSDKNRSAYGLGAYFAAEAEYSSRNAYAEATKVGERHMFMCRVLVGEYAKGDQNMRLPPEIPNSGGKRYNSTVDDEAKPTIFVTYSDAQAYPDYFIVFKDN